MPLFGGLLDTLSDFVGSIGRPYKVSKSFDKEGNVIDQFEGFRPQEFVRPVISSNLSSRTVANNIGGATNPAPPSRPGNQVPQVDSISGFTPPPSRATKEMNPYSDWMGEQAQASGIRPDVLDYLENVYLPMTRQYGIPDSLAAAQWAVESGRVVKDNPVGLMRNNQLLDYGGLEPTVKAYHQTLQNLYSQNRGIPEDQFSYEGIDPLELLYYLQFQGQGVPGVQRYEAHMDNPQNYVDLIQSVPEWRHYYNR